MAGIFGAFGDFASIEAIGKLLVWIFVFIVIGISITAIFIMAMVKKKEKKIIEIDMPNKRINMFSGRDKKTKDKQHQQFWCKKIGRFLPKFQSKDIFVKGKQDVVILLKDNNGLLHTARIPTWKELKWLYKNMYGIDLDNEEDLKKTKIDVKELKKLRNVYLMPTPHEDLDWMVEQIAQSKKQFAVEHWWQSPAIAYIGVGFVCLMMIIATMILSRKL